LPLLPHDHAVNTFDVVAVACFNCFKTQVVDADAITSFAGGETFETRNIAPAATDEGCSPTAYAEGQQIIALKTLAIAKSAQ